MKDRPTGSEGFDPDEKLYTTAEVAETFSVTTETVRDWINAKKLPAIQIPGGQYRIKRSALLKFAESKYGS